MAVERLVHARAAVGCWTLWSLPRRARTFVLAVDAVYLGAVAAGVATTRWSAPDLVTFLVLVACALASIECSLRLVWRRPNSGSGGNDLLAIWTLPVALLLPPVYSALVVLPLLVFTQLRVVRRAPVKLLFSAASTGLAGFAAAVAHADLASGTPSWDVRALVGTGPAFAITVLCVLVRYGVNLVLIAEVVTLTRPGASLRSTFADLEALAVTAAEGCTGILVAVACAASPYAVLLAIPPVLVLQRTLLLAEFREAARTDPKTGLANSSYWREVADRELARARSGGEHLAVLLVDIDHFKAVNDRFGHLTGDEVLQGVASGLTHGLRPRDFVGRFGGEEFVVLLAGSDLDQARQAAERIRAHVAEVSVEASSRRAQVQVTVSIGVAAFRESGHSIHELLDAADMALYAAKRAGRNCVRVAEGVRQQVLDLTGDIPRVLDLYPQRAPLD